MGLGFMYRHSEGEDTGFAALDYDYFSGDLRFGMRWYRSVSEKTRPFTTLSALVGFRDGAGYDHAWRPGAAAEIGASHFFTPRVSLGASGELTVSGWREQLGTDPIRTVIFVRFSGFRLAGGVYF